MGIYHLLIAFALVFFDLSIPNVNLFVFPIKRVIMQISAHWKSNRQECRAAIMFSQLPAVKKIRLFFKSIRN